MTRGFLVWHLPHFAFASQCPSVGADFSPPFSGEAVLLGEGRLKSPSTGESPYESPLRGTCERVGYYLFKLTRKLTI